MKKLKNFTKVKSQNLLEINLKQISIFLSISILLEFVMICFLKDSCKFLIFIFINIQSLNNTFFAASVISLLLSEIIRKYTIFMDTKYLGINPKAYNTYYKDYKLSIIFLFFIIICFLLSCTITLLFINVILVVYILKIYFLNDYTINIKEAIKNGYLNGKNISNVKNISKEKANIFTNLRQEKIIEKENNHLLQKIILSSITDNESKNYEKKFEGLQLCTELIEELYNRLGKDGNIEYIIVELKKSIEAFFIFELNDTDSFSHYYNLLLSIFKMKNIGKYEYYNSVIYCSLICIISNLSINNDSNRNDNGINKDKVYYLYRINREISISVYDIYPTISYCLYVIIMWQLFINNESLELYKYYINKWQRNIILNKDTIAMNVEVVYKICKIIISKIYDYPQKNIDIFNKYFLYIYYCISDDINYSFISFIMEVK